GGAGWQKPRPGGGCRRGGGRDPEGLPGRDDLPLARGAGPEKLVLGEGDPAARSRRGARRLPRQVVRKVRPVYRADTDQARERGRERAGHGLPERARERGRLPPLSAPAGRREPRPLAARLPGGRPERQPVRKRVAGGPRRKPRVIPATLN